MLRRLTIFGLALCAVALPGCSNSPTDSPASPLAPSGERLNVASIASSVSTGGIEGVRQPGSAPLAVGGPAVAVTGNQTVVNGGTQMVTVTSASAFDTVYVTVGGRTLGLLGDDGGGVDGHYVIRLPGPQLSAAVLVAFPQEIPLTEFDLQFAVGGASGEVGPYAALATAVTSVGTGDVQVTLSWDADSDVDLHVIGPGGEEVFYAARQSSSGGELDLDSNAGCQIDGVRNENITWPVGRAPRGVYTVRVDYWNSCNVRETNYTVRINNGGAVQILSGSFTGPGDQGGPGSGRTVATFERLSGPTAAVPSLRRTLELAPGLKAGAVPSGAGR